MCNKLRKWVLEDTKLMEKVIFKLKRDLMKRTKMERATGIEEASDSESSSWLHVFETWGPLLVGQGGIAPLN